MKCNASGQGGWGMQRLQIHRNPPFIATRLLHIEQQGDMSLNFSHSFPLTFKFEDDFMTKIIGNVKWTVEFNSLKTNKAEIVISSIPMGETCQLVPWTVTFDVSVSKMNRYYQQETSIEHKKDIALHENLDCFKIECSFSQNDVSLKIQIFNVRIRGIHEFEMKNFDSTNADEDLVLDVDGVKLHCHSQILSWNSKIFRTMIKESKVSSEICLKDSIPVEDLRELLHYLYLPCEPVDDHNFRKLLQWGEKFQVKHVVQLCQRYMESLVLGQSITDAIRIEIFLLSWRYSIENLKNIYARKEVPLKSSGWMRTIVQTEVYQDMDKDLKLQIWEFLVETFEC